MKRTIPFAACCLILILSTMWVTSWGQKNEAQYDLVIRNGRILDGTGNPWYIADIGVQNGRIAKIGNLADAKGRKTIDARDLNVSPGFIDIHNHSDDGLIANPKAENYIRQGVTTLFIGHCGGSAAPSKEFPTSGAYLRQLEKNGIATNAAILVGHGTIRSSVMGVVDRNPTTAELGKMKALVAAAMEDGAYGLSTGLVYSPGTFAKTDEIIELCKVVAARDGIYATHVRDDGAKWEEAVQEALETARQSGVRLQIVHNESHYPNWGKLDMIMKYVDDARAQGLRVGVDVIPTLCGSQGIDTVFPNWALEGGDQKLVERLKDPAQRTKITDYVLNQKEQHTSPSSSLIADGYADKIWINGKNLAEIAKQRRQNPLDAAMDMVIERGDTYGIIMEFHNEDDLCKLIAHPLSSIGSDSRVQTFGKGSPHPRAYGCFPLIFRKYVRGETREDEPREVGRKILSLQEAVRKITSCPAETLGLRDRGLLREGYWADITIFDPQTIADRATYANPHQYPKGIPYVIVNGKLVIENSEHTGALPGQVLRGPRYGS